MGHGGLPDRPVWEELGEGLLRCVQGGGHSLGCASVKLVSGRPSTCTASYFGPGWQLAMGQRRGDGGCDCLGPMGASGAEGATSGGKQGSWTEGAVAGEDMDTYNPPHGSFGPRMDRAKDTRVACHPQLVHDGVWLEHVYAVLVAGQYADFLRRRRMLSSSLVRWYDSNSRVLRREDESRMIAMHHLARRLRETVSRRCMHGPRRCRRPW